MRLHVFLHFIALILSTGLAAQGNSSLEWGNPITYNDFESQPNRVDTAAANISVTILLGYSNTPSGELKYKVVAVMDKDQSWIKPEFKRDHILKHEQGHFDIAHIYARKLDASLKTKRYTSKDIKALSALYDRHLEEMNELQIRYDRETSGGWNALAQSKWRRYIERELDNSKR